MDSAALRSPIAVGVKPTVTGNDANAAAVSGPDAKTPFPPPNVVEQVVPAAAVNSLVDTPNSVTETASVGGVVQEAAASKMVALTAVAAVPVGEAPSAALPTGMKETTSPLL